MQIVHCRKCARHIATRSLPATHSVITVPEGQDSSQNAFTLSSKVSLLMMAEGDVEGPNDLKFSKYCRKFVPTAEKLLPRSVVLVVAIDASTLSL